MVLVVPARMRLEPVCSPSTGSVLVRNRGVPALVRGWLEPLVRDHSEAVSVLAMLFVPAPSLSVLVVASWLVAVAALNVASVVAVVAAPSTLVVVFALVVVYVLVAVPVLPAPVCIPCVLVPVLVSVLGLGLVPALAPVHASWCSSRTAWISMA